MNSLTKSIGVIGRSTKQLYYIPSVSIHVSSTLTRESVVDKAKHMADTVNKEAGKKISDVLEGAENATEAASKKAHKLKPDSIVNEVKHTADTVNKKTGEKVNDVIEGAEGMTDAASKKASNFKHKINNHASSEKTIVDTIKDGVEAAKKAVGLESKKAGHAVDEVMDEARLKAKKAANHVNESSGTASNYAKDAKNKASEVAQDAKEKACHTAEGMKGKAAETANEAQSKAKSVNAKH